MGELFEPFIKEADIDDRTKIISTEELCHEIQITNKRVLRAWPRVGPFQKAGDRIIKEVKQDILDSPVDVKGVNTVELALFLACSLSQG